MQLYEVIWKEQFVDKLEIKHQVDPDEVEQVLFTEPMCAGAQKGG